MFSVSSLLSCDSLFPFSFRLVCMLTVYSGTVEVWSDPFGKAAIRRLYTLEPSVRGPVTSMDYTEDALFCVINQSTHLCCLSLVLCRSMGSHGVLQ